MGVNSLLPRREPGLTDRVADTAGDAVDTVRTNPAVPVAGALGFVLLLSALMRRLRRRPS